MSEILPDGEIYRGDGYWRDLCDVLQADNKALREMLAVVPDELIYRDPKRVSEFARAGPAHHRTTTPYPPPTKRGAPSNIVISHSYTP